MLFNKLKWARLKQVGDKIAKSFEGTLEGNETFEG